MEVEGYVTGIRFRNDANCYTVFSLETKDDEITCVGKLSLIEEGLYLKLEGEMEDRSKWGPQFQVSRYEVKSPEDEIAMERYLASGVIRGVGPAMARKIVKEFGADTFRVIEEEPSSLSRIKGISERIALQIGEQFYEKSSTRNAMVFMQQYGITNQTAIKLYKQFGDEIYHILKENPYRLADEVNGIGFQKADQIAVKAGIPVDSDFRIRSAVLYVLQANSAEGHVYCPLEYLREELERFLHIEIPEIEEHLIQLELEKKIVVKKEPVTPEGKPLIQDGQSLRPARKSQELCSGQSEQENRSAQKIQPEQETRVYLTKFYYMELNCARMLHDLNLKADVEPNELRKKIRRIMKKEKFELDEKQVEAVCQAVSNGVLVLTGGPGTGKTTTINAMIQYFEEEGLEVLLAAPTGRAARRMKEATRCEAQTIHRLLGVTVVEENESSYMSFERGEDNPLEADAVIIDEASMVDITLLYSLLRAIAAGTRIIFVGDVDQLPSVGPGNCLSDIIESGCFPVVKLDQIFRQASESDIVMNAHRINRGEYPVMDKKSKDFFFFEGDDPKDILGIMYYLINNGLAEYVNAASSEIQILSPVKKGPLGVEHINYVLQMSMNPKAADKDEIEWNDRIYRVGDKVMQIKNNYNLEWEIPDDYGSRYLTGSGVYNGDIGVIRDINKSLNALKVEFEEGKLVEYSFQELSELEHAYAITIHKSQGSEYPAVLIPLLSGSKLLYTRNLLYTAITRAKKCVCLVGSKAMIQQMVDNNQENRRYTTLAKRIRDLREE